MRPRQRALAASVSFLCVVFALLTVASCNNTAPELVTLYPRMVYSFEDESAQPDIRLSVYAEVSSQVFRLDKMEIKHKATGYTWTAENLDTARPEKENRTFIGASAFFPYDNTAFPTGEYLVTLYDMAGRKEQTSFNVRTQSATLPSTGGGQTPNYVVTDADGTILYMGPETGELRTKEGVKFTYPAAVQYRRYVYRSSTHALYLYPPVLLKDD